MSALLKDDATLLKFGEHIGLLGSAGHLPPNRPAYTRNGCLSNVLDVEFRQMALSMELLENALQTVRKGIEHWLRPRMGRESVAGESSGFPNGG